MEIKVLASGSGGNCIYISDGETPLLLDAGIPFKEIQRKLNFKTSGIAGVLVSHAHLDHCKAVKDLLRAGINCYMGKAAQEALGVSGHRAHLVRNWRREDNDEGQAFRLVSWSIRPFDAVHDIPCFGYFLISQSGERVLYLTDSAYCKYRFKGLTHILIGVNYDEELIKENVSAGETDRYLKNRVMTSHMALDTLITMLKANDLSQVKGIWLLHLSKNNAEPEMFRRKIQEATGKPVYLPPDSVRQAQSDVECRTQGKL